MTHSVQPRNARVHIIVPIVTEGFRAVGDFLPFTAPGIDLSMSQITSGPVSIESEFDDALAVPGILAAALQAQRDGVDAIVIDCMADPGIFAARELLDIPVFGPGQTSMSVAGILAHKFGYLTIMDELISVTDSRAAVYGQRDKMVGIRSVNVPVLEIEADPERTVTLLAKKALELIAIGAGAVIFGCTGLMWAASALEERLALAGHPGVRVINPIPTTINFAGAMVHTGLTVSKHSYPTPPAKTVVGYPLLEQLPTFA